MLIFLVTPPISISLLSSQHRSLNQHLMKTAESITDKPPHPQRTQPRAPFLPVLALLALLHPSQSLANSTHPSTPNLCPILFRGYLKPQTVFMDRDTQESFNFSKRLPRPTNSIYLNICDDFGYNLTRKDQCNSDEYFGNLVVRDIIYEGEEIIGSCNTVSFASDADWIVGTMPVAHLPNYTVPEISNYGDLEYTITKQEVETRMNYYLDTGVTENYYQNQESLSVQPISTSQSLTLTHILPNHSTAESSNHYITQSLNISKITVALVCNHQVNQTQNYTAISNSTLFLIYHGKDACSGKYIDSSVFMSFHWWFGCFLLAASCCVLLAAYMLSDRAVLALNAFTNGFFISLAILANLETHFHLIDTLLLVVFLCCLLVATFCGVISYSLRTCADYLIMAFFSFTNTLLLLQIIILINNRGFTVDTFCLLLVISMLTLTTINTWLHFYDTYLNNIILSLNISFLPYYCIVSMVYRPDLLNAYDFDRRGVVVSSSNLIWLFLIIYFFVALSLYLTLESKQRRIEEILKEREEEIVRLGKTPTRGDERNETNANNSNTLANIL